MAEAGDIDDSIKRERFHVSLKKRFHIIDSTQRQKYNLTLSWRIGDLVRKNVTPKFTQLEHTVCADHSITIHDGLKAGTARPTNVSNTLSKATQCRWHQFSHYRTTDWPIHANKYQPIICPVDNNWSILKLLTQVSADFQLTVQTLSRDDINVQGDIL